MVALLFFNFYFSEYLHQLAQLRHLIGDWFGSGIVGETVEIGRI